MMRLPRYRMMILPLEARRCGAYDGGRKKMKPHKFVTPEGTFWRGLCPVCGKERQHSAHREEAAVELAGKAQLLSLPWRGEGR
jgi:hypothetical protein